LQLYHCFVAKLAQNLAGSREGAQFPDSAERLGDFRYVRFFVAKLAESLGPHETGRKPSANFNTMFHPLESIRLVVPAGQLAKQTQRGRDSMPDWGLEPGQGLWTLVAMIVAGAFVAALPVIVVGRYDAWLWIGTVVAAIGLGVWGAIDHGLFGAWIGALVGGGATFFLLAIPIGILGALASFRGLEVDRHGRPNQSSAVTRIFLGTGRLVGVVLIGLVCYEGYWLANIAADIACYKVGATIYEVHEDETTEDLNERLEQLRPAAAAFQIPPLVWLLHEEERETRDETLRLIDYLTEKHEEGEEGESIDWQPWLADERAAALLQPDNRVELTRPSLQTYGLALCRRASDQLDACYEQTQVLHLVPRKTDLVPDEVTDFDLHRAAYQVRR